MKPDFETTVNVLLGKNGSGAMRITLLENIWQELKKNPEQTAAKIRAISGPDESLGFPQSTIIDHEEQGRPSAGVNALTLATELALIADQIGCDCLRVDWLKSTYGPRFQVVAMHNIGGEPYAFTKSFSEAELLAMVPEIAVYAVDLFCGQSKSKIEKAKDIARHGK